MRRILALVLCCVLFVFTAYADNGASSVQSTAAVGADGSCQISLYMTIRLDEPVSELTLPLGTDLSSVRLNGSSTSLKTQDGITSVVLSDIVRGFTGNVSFQVNFTVNRAVHTDEDGKTTITVPLIYGFAYPVETMNFSVTMPGEFDTVPVFRSGYHQQDIESNLTASVQGTTISGSITEPLKDHETLIMSLQAPEGMFAQAQTAGGTVALDGIAMAVCGGLALLYWLLTMASLPRFPRSRSTAPEGVNAGSVGCWVGRKPANLSLMVIHWAQMGYLIIHMNEYGRVMLHKKMEMGNERSAFEGRIFRALFSKGGMVDAASFRYARICDKTVRQSRKHSWGYRKESGDARVLRILGFVAAVFAGVAMGDSLATMPAWRVVLMVIFGVGAGVCGWFVQDAFGRIWLPGKPRQLIALAAALTMVLAGLISGQLLYALAAVAGNLVVGLLMVRTGRRSDNGNQVQDDIMGLRRYMCRVNRQELARIMRSNPDYYYELAPYALALGVDKRFAKGFGSLKLTHCTWLNTGMGAPGTAGEWYLQLREVLSAMNDPEKRMPWERFMNRR